MLKGLSQTLTAQNLLVSKLAMLSMWKLWERDMRFGFVPYNWAPFQILNTSFIIIYSCSFGAYHSIELLLACSTTSAPLVWCAI